MQALMKALNWVDSPIPGKMAAVLQLTDTYLARRLKVHAEREKDELRQVLSMKALKEHVRPNYAMQAADIWRIVRGTAQSNQHRHHQHHHVGVIPLFRSRSDTDDDDDDDYDDGDDHHHHHFPSPQERPGTQQGDLARGCGPEGHAEE